MPNHTRENYHDVSFLDFLEQCMTREPVHILTLSFTSRRCGIPRSTRMQLTVPLFRDHVDEGNSMGHIIFFAPHLDKWVEIRIIETPHLSQEDNVRLNFEIRKFSRENSPQGPFATQVNWLRPWYPEEIFEHRRYFEISVVSRVSTVGMWMRKSVEDNEDERDSELGEANPEWEVEGVEFGARTRGMDRREEERIVAKRSNQETRREDQAMMLEYQQSMRASEESMSESAHPASGRGDGLAPDLGLMSWDD